MRVATEIAREHAKRGFLYVRDVCDAYLALLTITPTRARVLVNVASGEAHRIGDLLEQLRGMASMPFAIARDPTARVRPKSRFVGRSEELMLRVGWTPKIGIRTNLRDVLDEQRGLLTEP